MKSLFDKDVHRSILQRIDNLTEQSTPNWGSMNVEQMLKHCQKPIEVANGTLQLEKPNFMVRMLMKFFKSSLYDDKPWKQGIPTAKEYRIVNTESFLTEKQRLIEKINTFHAKANQTVWPTHPIFGEFTPEQWAMSQYKHLDHHLRQFGV